MMHPDHDRYAKACEFPGSLDESSVEDALAQYLEALGMKRKITRIRAAWTLEEHPELERYTNEVLDTCKPILNIVAALASRDIAFARACLETLYASLVPRACDARIRWLREQSTVDPDDFIPSSPIEEQDEKDARDALVALDGIATFDVGVYLNRLAYRQADAARRALEARCAGAALAQSSPFGGFTPHAVLESLRSARYLPPPIAPLAVRYSCGARAPGHALHALAVWCIQTYSLQSQVDPSSLGTTWLRATTKTVPAWSQPLFEAHVAGAWILHWTEETLFWVAKASPHLERPPGRPPRLHRVDGPALESDVENLYFWHGVRVPAFVLTRPERITVEHIRSEENAEVRRIMIERYGPSRFILDSKAEVLHQDEFGTLYRAPLENDEPLVMVRVVNSTPEPDGSRREYFLRVPPLIMRAREAVAWTFGLRETEYSPEAQT